MPSLFYTVYMVVHFKIQHWYKSPRKKEPQSNLSKEKKIKKKGEKTSDGENGTCAFFSFFLFTSAYFNKENKHEQRCGVVVIRSAGLVVPNSWVLKCQSLSRWSTLTPWRHVYYYILLLCGCSEIGPSPCPLSVMCKTVQKSSPQWALSVRGRPLSPSLRASLSVVFFTRLFLLRDLKVCVTPSRSAHASHDARLDVLVGDLLVVVVRAAARRVHRRGRHGVEGEDELLSVAHARRLGMVAGNTL